MILKNCAIWVGTYDVTADFNQVSLSEQVEVLDDTRFGPVLAKAVAAGLRSAQLSGKAFFSADDDPIAIDDILVATHALANVPISIANSNAGVVGELAYTLQARTASLARGGRIGELLPIDLAANSHGSPLVHGLVLQNGAESSSGSETGQNLGVLASGKTLYAALHILAISGGGTLTVKVQSDELVGFSSPTDRLTFAAATAIGSEWLSLAGPIPTDAYWRANWTLSAGTATFAVVAGFA